MYVIGKSTDVDIIDCQGCPQDSTMRTNVAATSPPSGMLMMLSISDTIDLSQEV